MKNFKRVIGFLVFMFLVLTAIPSVSYAADGQQYSENLIPQMTSDTAPSGKASASSFASDAYHAYDAFDHDYSTANGWVTKADTAAGWLEYDFDSTKCITKYTIVSRNVSDIRELPRVWSFEAWDEQSQNWVALNTQSNVTDWTIGVKKEFTFTNIKSYYKYRIKIMGNCGGTFHTGIGELEMMETVPIQVSAPTNLTAISGDSKIYLSWNAVEGATSYNVKRSETSGGPYTTVASVTGSAITYTDIDVKPTTTYYYVINTINENGESANSNEVSATPTAPVNVLKLVLEVKEEKQLSVSDDLGENADMTWTSSDLTIATVDENGLLKALKPGDTVITCTSKDGEYTETIKVLVVDLELQLAVDLKIGETCRLTIDDLKNTTNVTWAAYESAIATVTNKGKVTAVSEGLTYITVTDGEGKEIGRIYIRVRNE